MARLKRSSTILETAQERLSGLKTITPKPNYGPALDLDQYEAEVNAFEEKLNRYNDNIALIDRLANELDDGEAHLRDKNRRMLAATEAHYGPDSSEYEAVGGTRTSDRKPNTKKKPGNS